MSFEPSRLASYDKDSILAEITRVVLICGGRYCTQDQFNQYARVHSGTVTNIFGSWEEAIQAAGFECVRTSIDTAELLSDLRKLAKIANGKYFTQEFYKANGGKYSRTTLITRLGYPNWTTLLERELGIHLPVKRVIERAILKKIRPLSANREELLAEMQRVWKQLGKRPTSSVFVDNSNIGIKAYRREFGSWVSAVEAFESQYGSSGSRVKRTGCTREMLLLELKAVAAKTTSTAMRYEDYRSLGGTYHSSVFRKWFGNWKKAVAQIGLTDGLIGPFADEEFFIELQKVWEILGRQPISREMKPNGSKMSANAFRVRFGTWNKAIHAFCADRNSADVASDSHVAELASPAVTVKPVNETMTIEPPKILVAANQIVIKKRTPRQASLRLRFKVLQRDNFTCRACGRSPASHLGLVLQVDHILPYSGPGETVFENLQTLCIDCNLGKSDLLPTKK